MDYTVESAACHRRSFRNVRAAAEFRCVHTRPRRTEAMRQRSLCCGKCSCKALDQFPIYAQLPRPPISTTTAHSRTSSKERPGGVVGRISSLEESVDVPDEVREVSIATYFQRNAVQATTLTYTLVEHEYGWCSSPLPLLVGHAPVFCRKNSQAVTSPSTRAA